MNIYLNLSDNYYLTITQDSKAQENDDITVHFNIAEGLEYTAIRFDYWNMGAGKSMEYLHGRETVPVTHPFNKRGFLSMQLVVDTKSEGKRNSNVVILHIPGSIYGGQDDTVLRELERLAFCWCTYDPQTQRMKFFNVIGDEVQDLFLDIEIPNLDELLEQVADHERRIETLELDLAELDTTVSDHTDKIVALTESLNTLTTEVSQMRAEINLIDSRITEAIALYGQLVEKTDRTNDRVDALEITGQDHERRITAAETAIAGILTRLDTNDNDITDINDRIAAINTRIDGIDDEISTMQTDITKLRQDVDKNTADIANAFVEIDTKAPINHASTVETYGVGSDTEYGHVKLTDTLAETRAITGDAVATTRKAVNDGLSSLNTQLRAALTASVLELEESIADTDGKAVSVQNELTDHKETGTEHDWRYYTQDEIDNKITAITSALIWHPSVPTFDDLATTYPDALEGWAVSVDADNAVYRYNGTTWEEVFKLLLNVVTEDNDGLMTSEMLALLNATAIKAGDNETEIENIYEQFIAERAQFLFLLKDDGTGGSNNYYYSASLTGTYADRVNIKPGSLGAIRIEVATMAKMVTDGYIDQKYVDRGVLSNNMYCIFLTTSTGTSAITRSIYAIGVTNDTGIGVFNITTSVIDNKDIATPRMIYFVKGSEVAMLSDIEETRDAIIDQLDEEITNLETQISDTNTRIDDVESEIRGINTNVGGLQMSINDLTGVVDGIYTDLDGTKERVTANEQSIIGINQDLAEKKRNLWASCLSSDATVTYWELAEFEFSNATTNNFYGTFLLTRLSTSNSSSDTAPMAIIDFNLRITNGVAVETSSFNYQPITPFTRDLSQEIFLVVNGFKVQMYAMTDANVVGYRIDALKDISLRSGGTMTGNITVYKNNNPSLAEAPTGDLVLQPVKHPEDVQIDNDQYLYVLKAPAEWSGHYYMSETQSGTFENRVRTRAKGLVGLHFPTTTISSMITDGLIPQEYIDTGIQNYPLRGVGTPQSNGESGRTLYAILSNVAKGIANVTVGLSAGAIGGSQNVAQPVITYYQAESEPESTDEYLYLLKDDTVGRYYFSEQSDGAYADAVDALPGRVGSVFITAAVLTKMVNDGYITADQASLGAASEVMICFKTSSAANINNFYWLGVNRSGATAVFYVSTQGLTGFPRNVIPRMQSYHDHDSEVAPDELGTKKLYLLRDPDTAYQYYYGEQSTTTYANRTAPDASTGFFVGIPTATLVYMLNDGLMTSEMSSVASAQMYGTATTESSTAHHITVIDGAGTIATINVTELPVTGEVTAYQPRMTAAKRIGNLASQSDLDTVKTTVTNLTTRVGDTEAGIENHQMMIDQLNQEYLQANETINQMSKVIYAGSTSWKPSDEEDLKPLYTAPLYMSNQVANALFGQFLYMTGVLSNRNGGVYEGFLSGISTNGETAILVSFRWTSSDGFMFKVFEQTEDYQEYLYLLYNDSGYFFADDVGSTTPIQAISGSVGTVYISTATLSKMADDGLITEEMISEGILNNALFGIKTTSSKTGTAVYATLMNSSGGIAIVSFLLSGEYYEPAVRSYQNTMFLESRLNTIDQKIQEQGTALSGMSSALIQVQNNLGTAQRDISDLKLDVAELQQSEWQYNDYNIACDGTEVYFAEFANDNVSAALEPVGDIIYCKIAPANMQSLQAGGFFPEPFKIESLTVYQFEGILARETGTDRFVGTLNSNSMNAKIDLNVTYTEGSGIISTFSADGRNNDNIPHRSLMAKMRKTGGTNPISFVSSPSLKVNIAPGTYSLQSYDGDNISFELLADQSVDWIDGHYIYYDKTANGFFISDSFYDYSVVESNMFNVGYMMYTGSSIESVYLDGFGTLQNTPAQFNRSFSYVLSVPSTSTIVVNDTQVVITLGSSTFINAMTALPFSRSIAQSTLSYSSGSILYLQEGVNTILATDPVAIPLNCSVIGSMNTVNGKQSVNIFGLGTFEQETT